MKVSSGVVGGFSPRSLTIVFETQDELDTFGSLFNYSPNGSILRKFSVDGVAVCREVAKLGGNIYKVDRFCGL